MDLARQRQHPIVTVAPYVLLAILVAVTVALKQRAGGSLLIDLGLCALAAVWMLWLFTLHPTWRDRPPVMAVFCVGLIVINGVLAVRDPWFGCFTPATYTFVFRFLPWPGRLPAVGAVAIVAGTAQVAGVDKSTVFGVLLYIGALAVNVLPMCGFAWFSWRHTQAHHQLEVTLAENESLQERLVAQARETGMRDERQRMAREIHDTLAQGLTGIITQLQAAEQADERAEWRRHVRAATTLARESLSEARRSVDALRPEPLETARLGDALAAVAQRWSVLHGITVAVTTTGTPRPMRPDAEFALLRTAQEALANVAKHARANRVGVTLSYMEHEVALDVRDDGTGFDQAMTNGGGFGLVAMRERIEGVPGTLSIESEPGVGTAISARVPAEKADA